MHHTPCPKSAKYAISVQSYNLKKRLSTFLMFFYYYGNYMLFNFSFYNK